MAKTRKKLGKSNKDVYEKAEDLPEGKKKMYNSIREDFDKQGKMQISSDFSLFCCEFNQVRQSGLKIANAERGFSIWRE